MTWDDALARRLTEQRRERGSDYRFYRSKEWRNLRANVLAANHYECAMCKAKSPARYSRAVTVHHVCHVEDAPGLALSETYVDHDGIERDNLMPLCHECHDKVHHRFRGRGHDTSGDVTEERW